LSEPLKVHGLHRGSEAQRVAELLQLVGLRPEFAQRYPHEFSGGQRQRIGIARALAVEPMLIVCDEAVSALDVSIQAQVMNLLMDLRDELGLSYVFISHDLAVVRQIADTIAVMYLGQIVEYGDAEQIYEHPQHPYTAALLSAVPVADPVVQRTRTRIPLSGDLPSPADPPSGCRFRTRCFQAQAKCAESMPLLLTSGPSHEVACHFPLEAVTSV
jgi:ABC-type dipeptide/oligopeptide/nickel transport system ATPase component